MDTDKPKTLDEYLDNRMRTTEDVRLEVSAAHDTPEIFVSVIEYAGASQDIRNEMYVHLQQEEAARLVEFLQRAIREATQHPA
jgi:hypothetical protein